MNLADTVKKQTDRILRQQRQNGTGSVIITGNPSGDPIVTLPFDEAAHDALDHTGLTGVPAAEAFTESVHAATDHTGITGVGGADTFLELTDTPAAYTGKAGKVVAVNVGETALEFITPSSGTSGTFDFGLITDASSYSWDWGSLA